MFASFFARMRHWMQLAIAVIGLSAFVAPAAAVTINIPDQANSPGTASVTIAANDSLLVFDEFRFPAGDQDFFFQDHVFTLTGTLPPGMSFTHDGERGFLRGPAPGVGVYNFSVSVVSQSSSGSVNVTYTVTAPNLVLLPAPGAVATGRINTPGYSQQFTAAGGNGPHSFSITAGALPTGLTLDSASGALTGTPTQAGTFNISVTATDSTGGAGSPFSITQAYSVIIYDVVQVTNASPLPDATVGTAYSQQMTASGGNGPAYTFGVSFGTLPAGLTLSSSGLLSGTPTAGGDFFFSISATDPGGVSRSKNFPLTVNPPAINIQPASLNNATVGVLFNQTLAATGGTGPYT